jgi:hypothetical protein
MAARLRIGLTVPILARPLPAQIERVTMSSGNSVTTPPTGIRICGSRSPAATPRSPEWQRHSERI